MSTTTTEHQAAPPRHRGAPRRCAKCGQPEDKHRRRHAFQHLMYEHPVIGMRRTDVYWFRRN